MDAAKLQTRIYQGYAQAAKRIGTDYTIYRPAMAIGAVIDPANIVTVTKISFNSQDMTYGKPSGYGTPQWYALFDGSLANVGDFLAGPQGTYFVAAKQLDLPILAMECNRTVTVSHSDMLSQSGAIGYADTADDEVSTQGPWPASVLQSGRGAGVAVDSDIKNPAWLVLMPAFAGTIINTGDILTDDLDRRYAVTTAELSDLGWRIQAVEVAISKQGVMSVLSSGLR